MNFREAIDELCKKLSHEDAASALNVSLQSIRQARMAEGSKAYRHPPKDWRYAVIRLAEAEIMRYRRLIDRLREEI